MTRIRREARGQLALPMLGILLLLSVFLAGYIRWCRAVYWTMRLETAADFAALSAARSQALMLNRISASNTMINLFVQKAQVPGIPSAVGFMAGEMEAGYRAWNQLLRIQVQSFASYPTATGRQVAKANGAQVVRFLLPMPMKPYLSPRDIYVVKKIPGTPIPVPMYLPKAYFAREWPGRQPPHRTLWSVSARGLSAMGRARLWMDVQPGTFLNNGGFPPPRESGWGGVLIQGGYPQFNARLLNPPTALPARIP